MSDTEIAASTTAVPATTATAPAATGQRVAIERLRAVRAPRPAVQGLLAFAVYFAVYVAGFALPLISHLNVPKVRQDWTDPNFYTWAMGWWPYAVTHWINPLYSAQIGAPGGYNLAWATTTPSVALVMWPVTALFGPVLAFNIVLLAVPPLSGLAAFAVARRLTGKFWAALLAGAVYGFCPLELAHSLQGQPNLTVIGLLPVLAYLVLLRLDETLGPIGYTIATAVVMALEFYTFSETFFYLTMVWIVGLLTGFAVAGRAARGAVARLAGLTGIAYAGACALAAPYLVYALNHYPATLIRQRPIFSLHLVRLILPSSDKLFGVTPLTGYSSSLSRYSIEDYVGIPMLAVLIGLAVTAWRDRITRLLIIGFVLIVALAVGPVLVLAGKPVFPLPWGGLWSLPIARSAEPSRIMVFGFLVAALALALWLAAPSASHWARAARWGLGLLAVVAIFADLPGFSRVVVARVPPGEAAILHPHDELPPFLTDRMYTRYLRPGETVVVVTGRGNAGMLFQAGADFYFRIAGGFINTSMTREDALPLPVALLTAPTKERIRGFRAYVRRAGIGAVLVEESWAEPWTRIFRQVGLRGIPVGGVTVYPTKTAGPR